METVQHTGQSNFGERALMARKLLDEIDRAARGRNSTGSASVGTSSKKKNGIPVEVIHFAARPSQNDSDIIRQLGLETGDESGADIIRMLTLGEIVAHANDEVPFSRTQVAHALNMAVITA